MLHGIAMPIGALALLLLARVRMVFVCNVYDH